ncbi:pentatricopeptide repeat-containing protein At2g20540-like isoform X2 [Syzygium oleosum]|uniref:pentatricopeptide repeat-containing protein At2g20540-like isoform X2 n=1 Tax=Syzygium oleosum TaxID=219896 RepID=UPI0024B9AFC9|nr:pentatricopeptide repeat-containing protein At2g20540-like isoform X2 [Syzygium oleosum]
MVHSPSPSHLGNPLIALLQRSKSTSQILQIHAQLITTSFISDSFTSGKLLTSLTSLNTPHMDHARLVFDQIRLRSVFTYNTMIRGYVGSSNPEKAWSFYAGMRRKGLVGDDYTYPFVLKACGMMMGLAEGRLVHGELVKRGRCCHVFAVNGLIGMYGKCGEMGCARMAFDGVEEKDSVSWNLLLSAYVGCGNTEEAQKVFDEMPEKDVISWSMMIDAYGKNVISWSILLDGYVSNGNPLEALKLFKQMLLEHVKVDKVAVVGALSACAQLGALVQGRWMHIYVERNRIDVDIVVQAALLDMYMKCGSVNEASRAFYSMSERNAICYSVMIFGYGTNGHGKKALELFRQMVWERNVWIDDMLFLAVLTACSHAGFVYEGLCIFEQMKGAYGIEPKLEHYSCLVDLLSRSGQLDSAREVIKSMPMTPNCAALWGSLLLACRTHRDVMLAEVAVKKLVELKADDCGTYILLSNIYADMGLQEESLRVWKLMKNRSMEKETGKSSIEVNGIIKEFVSGENSSIVADALEWIIWSLSSMPLHE